MAKKHDKLDEINLDDFDLDFNFHDNPSIKKNDRGPVMDAGANVFKGFKSVVANKSFIERVMRKVLPKGFSDAYDQAQKVVTRGRSLYNGVTQDVRPAYEDMSRAVRQLAPIVRDKGHDTLASKLEKLFKGEEKTSWSGPSEDPETSGINQQLTEIFKLQAEDKERDQQTQRAEDQLKDRTATRRHTDLMNQQTIVASGINTLVGYQKQITSRYQQKMLELNFRQYYALRDMVGTLQAYAKDTHTQLESVIHNTGLPDIVKMQASEQFTNQARARMFGKVQERVGDYFRNYTDKIFDNVEREVKGFTNNISMGLRAGAQLIDAKRMEMEYDDGSDGEGVAGLAGKGLGYALGQKLGQWGKGLLGRNQKVQDLGAKLGYYANNIPEALNQFRENRTYYGDFRDDLMNGARRILPGPFQREKNLAESDPLHGATPTAFDNQTHKTINVILPGLLSRMLQSLEFARTGRDPGRIVWNAERNAFTLQRERTADAAHAILGDKQVQSIRDAANSMVDRVDPDKKLSAAARKALADKLIEQADTGASFSPSKLSTGHVDFSDNPEVHSELTQHFRDRYKTDVYGKTGEDAETYHKMAADSGAFRYLRDAMPEVYATINRLVNHGSAEDLRALGILKPDPNNPRKEIIDYSFIQNRTAGQDWTINDASGLTTANAKGGKGRRNPTPATPGFAPAPQATPHSQESGFAPVQMELSRGFDRLMDAITKSIGGLGTTIVEQSDRQVKATEEFTAKPEATEALTWLSRIAKIVAAEGRRKGGRRSRGTEDAEGDTDADDWDEWDTMDGDFFDRARGRYGRGRKYAKRAYGRGKEFAGRQWDRAKDLGGRAYNKGKELAKGVKDWALSGRSVLDAAIDTVGTTFNAFREVFDIYTKDGKEPVMTAVKMRNGYYFDFHTGKAILKFSDIEGPVVDKDGNMVLTEEDIRNGLFGSNGKPVGGSLLRGVIRGLGKAGETIMGLPRAYYELLARTTKKTLNIAHNLIDGPADVYVAGEDSPRLLAIIMRRNGYLSKATRRPIYRPSEIDGEVIDLQGNTVLALEDLQKGLVDAQGRKIVGVGGKLWRATKSTTAFAADMVGKTLKFANRVRKYAWDKTVAGAKAVGRGIRGVGRFLSKGIHFNASLGIGFGIGGAPALEPVISGLEAIYNLLDDRLPGQSKLRTGSWQEKFSKRGSPKETMRKIEQASESNPLLKYLMMFGGAVMSGFAWLKSKLGGIADFFTKGRMLKQGADMLGDAMDAGDLVSEGKGARKAGRLGRIGKAVGRGLGKVGRGLGTVGRVALAAAPVVGEAALGMFSAAGSVLAGIGTAAAALITSPVAIAVGVAAAGYFAYKYFKGRPQPLQRLRLAEYGFDPSDKDALKKILELEGALMPAVQIRGTDAQLSNVNMEDVMTRLEIPNDPAKQQPFVAWFVNRFRPVFLRNVGELKRQDASVNLLEADDKLDKSKMVDFAVASKTPPQDAVQPYRIGGQPFGDLDPITTGTKTIDEEIQAIRDEFGKYKKDTDKGAVASTPGDRMAKTVANAAGIAGGAVQAVQQEQSGQHPTGEFQASTQTYVTPSEQGAGGYEPGITAQQWSPGSNRLLDDLTAVRMRMYGLTTLDISQVNALTTLETNVQDYVVIDNNGKVSIKRSAESIYQENAGLFGRNPRDLQAQKEWIDWFNYRFLPVYVQFVNAVYAINRNIKPGLAWKYLRPEDMLSIAELLKGTKASTPDGAVSVWAVPASAFAGVTPNNDISTIDANLTSLRTQIKNNQYKEKSPNAALNRNGQGSGTDTSNAAAAQTQDGKGGLWQSIKNWFSGGDNKPSVAAQAALGGAGTQGIPSYNAAWGGATGIGGGGPVAAMGTPIQQPGNGTGGDINQIPVPDGDGSWDALKKTIVAAATMAGVDPGLMASMAFVESGFRAAVKPGTSAAQGLYQFIPSTWKTMIQKYASKYGIAPNTPPSDPRANALMGAEYLKENQKILEEKLGRPVTGTDLYMAHFLGSAGGPRLLKAPSGDPAVNHVDASAASANSTIFYNGNRPKTVAEVIAWANKRIEQDGGKFMSEANALAGNPAALKAANDPSTKSAPSANDANGNTAAPTGNTQSADGSSAYEQTQQQAQAFNSANGVPAAQPTPAPLGAGAGPAPRAPAPSAPPAPTDATSSASVPAAPAPTVKDTQDYVAAAQSDARQSKEKEQVDGANGMLAVMQKQLETQQAMSSSLKALLDLFQKGGVNIGGGKPASEAPSGGNTVPNQRNGNTSAGSERVEVPISMKRKTG